MPSAPKIRKEILHILESSILPALRQQEVLQVLAGPPFDFSLLHPQIVREEFLPDNDQGPLQVVRKWPDDDLVANRTPNFSFCYVGAMHRMVGITEKIGNEMVRHGLPRPPGLQMIRVHSPSILVSSPFTAREGSPARPVLEQDVAKTCSITLGQNEVHIFHSARSPQQRAGSHHLAIQDPILYRLLSFYYEALCQQTDHASTQALLLAAYLRVHHQLSHYRPQISHSCWLEPVADLQYTLEPAESKHQALCRELIDYIHHHLHLPLSITMLAEHFNVSAFHLNRVFRASQHTTVMHYVTELRIKAAQRMLIGNVERINEIAQLVGFNSVAHFSNVFRRYTGHTPSQYRKLHSKRRKVA